VLQNWNHLSQEVIEADSLTRSTPSSHHWKIQQELGLKIADASQPNSLNFNTATGMSVRLVCLSHSWAVHKQLDWIDMPICNARQLAFNTIDLHLPYLHPPQKGQLWWESFGPLWSVGMVHDNTFAHGNKMTRLIPFKLGIILRLDQLQTCAKVGVERWCPRMPLVLGRHYRLCLTLTVTDLPNARVHNKLQGANTIHCLLYCRCSKRNYYWNNVNSTTGLLHKVCNTTQS